MSQLGLKINFLNEHLMFRLILLGFLFFCSAVFAQQSAVEQKKIIESNIKGNANNVSSVTKCPVGWRQGIDKDVFEASDKISSLQLRTDDLKKRFGAGSIGPNSAMDEFNALRLEVLEEMNKYKAKIGEHCFPPSLNLSALDLSKTRLLTDFNGLGMQIQNANR